MATYTVGITETKTYRFTVIADNEQDAYETAHGMDFVNPVYVETQTDFVDKVDA